MARLLRSSLTVSSLTFLSRILGLLRDLILASLFGAGGSTDAFFTAFRIPNFFRRLFAEGAFSQAFVPVLADYKQNRPEALKPFIDRIAGSLALLLLLVTAFGVIFSPQIVLLFAPGFAGSEHRYPLAVELLRLTFPYLFFISLVAFCGSLLNSFGHFAVPALTPLLLNLSLITAALWLTNFADPPIIALGWGVLLAGLLQLLIQFPPLRKRGLFPRLRFGLFDPGVRRVLKLMAPALVGISITQINLLIGTVLASLLPAGSISWLYYADRLMELPVGVFGVALGTVVLPALARSWASGERGRFRKQLDWAVRLLLLIALPAALGLALLAEPILATLFQRRAFGYRDVEMTAQALVAYAFGLPAFMAVKVLVPAYSARHDTTTPVKIGAVAVVTNILFSLLLIEPLRHAGLALATSLSAWSNALLLLLGLREHYRPALGLAFLLRLLLATAALGLFLSQAPPPEIWSGWSWSKRLPELLFWIGSGALLYGGTLLLLGLRPHHLVG